MQKKKYIFTSELNFRLICWNVHFTFLLKKMFTLWNYIYNRKNSKIIVLIQIKLQTFIQRIQTIFFINWVAVTQMVLRSLIGLLVTACGASKNGTFPPEFCRGFLWDYVARFNLEVPHPFRPLCILSYLCCLPRLLPAYKADLLWLLHFKVSGLEAHLHNSHVFLPSVTGKCAVT